MASFAVIVLLAVLVGLLVFTLFQFYDFKASVVEKYAECVRENSARVRVWVNLTNASQPLYG